MFHKTSDVTCLVPDANTPGGTHDAVGAGFSHEDPLAVALGLSRRPELAVWRDAGFSDAPLAEVWRAVFSARRVRAPATAADETADAAEAKRWLDMDFSPSEAVGLANMGKSPVEAAFERDSDNPSVVIWDPAVADNLMEALRNAVQQQLQSSIIGSEAKKVLRWTLRTAGGELAAAITTKLEGTIDKLEDEVTYVGKLIELKWGHVVVETPAYGRKQRRGAQTTSGRKQRRGRITEEPPRSGKFLEVSFGGENPVMVKRSDVERPSIAFMPVQEATGGGARQDLPPLLSPPVLAKFRV